MNSYTLVVDHRANLEIHATGCRDLAHVADDNKWVTVARTAQDALANEALPYKVKVNACCNPVRMAAAGRLNTIPDAPTIDPVDEAIAAVQALMAGEPDTTEVELEEPIEGDGGFESTDAPEVEQEAIEELA